jgi:ribonucleoside-diphosphate reductase beta chain
MTKIFFDGPVALSRYDRVKYPWMRKLTKQQRSFFWNPDEVELDRDAKEFRGFDYPIQRVLTLNLMRQILLDTKQGNAPSLAFGPICSLPEFENFLKCWEFFENNIHAESYQHILENAFPNASDVYDEVDQIVEIQACRTDISKYYDDLIEWNNWRELFGPDQIITHDGAKPPGRMRSTEEYLHKKALWLCLHAVNALEGVRFYVSFACAWAFAELKTMEGNAKIIKFIARDENIHLAFTQQLIRALPKDDPDFVQIKFECKGEVEKIFKDVADQEKDWAKYLFKDASMLGLNAELLSNFVDHRAWKCANAIGVFYEPKCRDNPLPWTGKWIGGAEVQVAPQETQQTQYTVGGTRNDLTSETFKGFEL